MSALTAMQKASVRLIGRRPSAFFQSENTFELELSDLANEVAEDLLESHEWQALTQIHEITGDGSDTSFEMPTDYSRMLINSEVQSTTNWAWGFEHVTDINDFIYRTEHGFEPYPGGWIIYGNELRFTPAPSTGDMPVFPYISKNYAKDSQSGLTKPAFDNDEDTFLLPERLLTLGLVWRWRENKKLDFTGDQEAFSKAFDEYASKDKGSRIYRTGNMRPGFSTAYPWPLG